MFLLLPIRLIRDSGRNGFGVEPLPSQVARPFVKSNSAKHHTQSNFREDREGLTAVDIIMNKQLPRLRRGLDIFPSPVPDRPGLLFRDPFRYADEILIIPPLLVAALNFFD